MFRATVVALAVAVLCACSSVPLHSRTGTITWTRCGSIQCASLSVPLDWARPGGRHITLALARHPASGHRIGVLLTNPGGPGASGVDFLRDATTVFPREVVRAFDIVSWDPRGVGRSAPVRCDTNLDGFYAVDRDPHTPAEVRANVDAARGFVATCARDSGDLLAHVSTTASADDLDAIRAAMGESTITFVGFSYGTLLGALYAQRHGQHVRAMVLDGAVDPSRSYADSTVDQAHGFEGALDEFLASCAACGFTHGEEPRQAFDTFVRRVRAHPITGTLAGEQRTLGPGELDIAVASALYAGKAGYDELAAALADGVGGRPQALLELADQYTERSTGGRYSNETAALYAIACIDAPSPRAVGAVRQIADRAERDAPFFGASTAWLGLPCTFWPVPPVQPVAPVHARGTPAIVVVGTTGDPATPYGWARSLARQLGDARLLTYEGAGHTAYGRGNACVDRAVDAYLLHSVVPSAGTVCAH